MPCEADTAQQIQSTGPDESITKMSSTTRSPDPEPQSRGPSVGYTLPYLLAKYFEVVSATLKHLEVVCAACLEYFEVTCAHLKDFDVHG